MIIRCTIAEKTIGRASLVYNLSDVMGFTVLLHHLVQ